MSVMLNQKGLNAQVPSPSAQPTMQFRTLGADCAMDGLFYQMGSNNVSVSIPQQMRSMPYDYSGASPLEIFKLITDKDGKPVHQKIASVDISQAGTFPLLVFFKGPKGPDQPIVSVLKEDAKAFPSGTFRIVNYSQNPLNASFPSGPLVVPRGSIKEYQGNEGGIFPVGISESTPTGSNLVFNSNVGILPGKRIMFLVLPPSQPDGHVQIQRHNDGAPIR